MFVGTVHIQEIKMFTSVKYLDGSKEDAPEVNRAGKVDALFENGDKFQGTYISDPAKKFVRDGFGTYTWKSGAVYSGDYIKGKREGQGTYTFPTGEVYEGLWKDGLKDGRGVYKYTNGDVFEGTWKKDKRDGLGKFTMQDPPREITGTWMNGKLDESTFEEREIKKTEDAVVVQETPQTAENAETPNAGEAEQADAEKAIDIVEDTAVVAVNNEEDLKEKKLGVIIAGAPASGKGSQCESISSEFGVIHISTGDLLRELAKEENESDLAKRTREYMQSGQLVPDDIVLDALKERIEKDDVKEKGFLLDGYPRTEGQAKSLDLMLKGLSLDVDIVLLLSVEEERLIERAVGRRTDPETGKIYHLKFNPPPEDIVDRLKQRKDDNEETMKNRIGLFNEHVKNIEKFYEKKLVMVDGNESREAIWENIKGKLIRLKEGEKVETLIQEEQS
eukprot:augustus_masked-scaffold_33-processed-gene-2.10-mRNA-1 protein AED:0.03 eAED:0.03 QI:0/0/0/0.5/1/1/2/0/446